MQKILYTTKEAAEQLSVCVQTVRLWINQGYLPVRRLGRLQRIHHADLEKFAKFAGELPSVWGNKPWKEERESSSQPPEGESTAVDARETHLQKAHSHDRRNGARDRAAS